MPGKIWFLPLFLIISLLGTWFIYRWGFKLGLADMPTKRSSHVNPTPKGGGVGMLISFLVASLVFNISIFIWLPLVILSIVSFLGDRIDISATIRLFLQVFLVSVIVVYMWTISSIALMDQTIFDLDLRIPNIIVCLFLILLIVGSANFYNFMDGIDGIAGATGVIAFGFIAYSCLKLSRSENLMYMAISMALACLGFLPLNFPKAKVFMGDVGSILLGGLFVVLIINLSKNWVELVCFLGFLFPFYADELTSVFDRLINQKSLLKPHRSHLYQILANEAKIPHWKVTSYYLAIQIFVSLLLVELIEGSFLIVLTFLSAAFLLFGIFSRLIKNHFKLQL